MCWQKDISAQFALLVEEKKRLVLQADQLSTQKKRNASTHEMQHIQLRHQMNDFNRRLHGMVQCMSAFDRYKRRGINRKTSTASTTAHSCFPSLQVKDRTTAETAWSTSEPREEDERRAASSRASTQNIQQVESTTSTTPSPPQKATSPVDQCVEADLFQITVPDFNELDKLANESPDRYRRMLDAAKESFKLEKLIIIKPRKNEWGPESEPFVSDLMRRAITVVSSQEQLDELEASVPAGWQSLKDDIRTYGQLRLDRVRERREAEERARLKYERAVQEIKNQSQARMRRIKIEGDWLHEWLLRLPLVQRRRANQSANAG